MVKSNPPEGNNVAANTLVTLYVSTGAAQVAVPDVEGKQESAAETTLQNDGFSVSIQQDTTSTQPSGTVVNQSPTGGTKVAPGSKVTIYVSGATSVPNVVGLPQASAQTSLQSAGFKVNVQTATGPAHRSGYRLAAESRRQHHGRARYQRDHHRSASGGNPVAVRDPEPDPESDRQRRRRRRVLRQGYRLVTETVRKR